MSTWTHDGCESVAESVRLNDTADAGSIYLTHYDSKSFTLMNGLGHPLILHHVAQRRASSPAKKENLVNECGPGLSSSFNDRSIKALNKDTSLRCAPTQYRQRLLDLEKKYDTLCQGLASKSPDRYSFPLTAEQVYGNLYEDDTNCFVALYQLRGECEQAAIDLYLAEHGQQDRLYGVCFDGTPVFFESLDEATAYPLTHAKLYPISAQLMYPASWTDDEPIVALSLTVTYFIVDR